MIQIFRLPDHATACTVARALQANGVTTRAGVRHEQAYLAVRSERSDVAEMVTALVPLAVPVVDHLPQDAPLSA